MVSPTSRLVLPCVSAPDWFAARRPTALHEIGRRPLPHSMFADLPRTTIIASDLRWPTSSAVRQRLSLHRSDPWVQHHGVRTVSHHRAVESSRPFGNRAGLEIVDRDGPLQRDQLRSRLIRDSSRMPSAEFTQHRSAPPVGDDRHSRRRCELEARSVPIRNLLTIQLKSEGALTLVSARCSGAITTRWASTTSIRARMLRSPAATSASTRGARSVRYTPAR